MESVKLNNAQQEAVNYCDGPLLIVAGPGTGKTRTIIEKISYLVKNAPKKYDPNKILVVTFTVKAAEELKERLRKSLGDDVETMQISTIHSFCQKMLETFSEYHSLGTAFEVMDEMEQFIFVNSKYRNFGLNEHTDKIKNIDSLINFYNTITENDIDIKELILELRRRRASKLEIDIAKSYELYIAHLNKMNPMRLDFAMLQREFYHLLLKNNEVLEKVREMFDYIFVDEHQDTNPIQDAIIRLISKPKYNITAVGDEDQSIYGFRGASIENFRSFTKRYPNSKIIKLEENYRSPEEIVKTFDEFMRPHRTLEKTIISKKGPGSKPILIKSESPYEEAVNVVEWIKQLKENNNVNYGDIAILFKSVKHHANEIIEMLKEEKIPYVVYGDSSLMRQEEIINTLVLMALVNEYDLEKYYYGKNLLKNETLIKSQLLNLDEKTKEYFKGKNIKDFFNYNYDSLERFGAPKKDIEMLINLKNLKEKKPDKPQLNLFYDLMEITHYLERLYLMHETGADPYAELKLKNLAKFSVILNKVHRITRSKKFNTLMYHLGRMPENKMEDAATVEDEDAVKIMTIHQAKGLEFPVVIIGGITQRRFSANNFGDNLIVEIPEHLLLNKKRYDPNEELRHAFYVAMSRAQKVLAMSYIDGQKWKKSEFITEIENRLGKNWFIKKEDYSEIFGENDHYVSPPEKRLMTFSAVDHYIICPFRFYLTYVLEFQTPEGERQVYGTVVHNCLKKLHSLMAQKKEINVIDIVDIVDTYCKEENTRKYRDGLITDLYHYYEDIREYVKEIIDVERPFSHVSSDLIINGQVDLVIKNKDDELEIVDFKAHKKEGIKQTNVDIQLRTYNMVLNSLYGQKISKISAYAFKDRVRVEFSNSDGEIEKTKQIIEEVEKSINEGKFYRNWKCRLCNSKTDGRCPFYAICYNIEEGDK